LNEMCVGALRYQATQKFGYSAIRLLSGYSATQSLSSVGLFSV